VSKKNTTVYLDQETLLKFDILIESVGTTRSKWFNKQMTKFVAEREKLAKVRKKSEDDYEW
jgi:metal-responsive CopG/Arc/MetJ family transcriptional regulator